MEMEGNGVSPLIQAPPAPAKEVDEAALGLSVTKRSRKRSRYLSPPYTDTDVQEKDAAGGSHKQQQQQQEEEEAPPDVSAAEALSALRAAALWQVQGLGEEEGADAAHFRFLSLYRNRSIVNHPDSPEPPSTSVAAGGVMLSLNPGPAIAMPMAAAADGALAKKKMKKTNPQPPAVIAAVKQQNGPVGNAAVLQQDAHLHIDRASQSPGFSANATAAATHGVANPVTLPTTTTTKKRRRNTYMKKRMKSPPGQQHYHFGNPVALVLDFAEGTPLPSKEDLVSTFRRFGLVIDSETAITHDKRSARVAFTARDQAEAAYSCAPTLGTFGPPFASTSLQDLPPITLSMPTPVPKLPLMDIRNNLEKMILSLTCGSSSGNLVGEMQGLLAKVNKKLQGAHHC